MKAAIFYGKQDLRVEQTKKPELREREVLVKIHACGICGTDVHIFEGDEGAAKSPAGIILGHEFAGEIVAVGTEVRKRRVGERVTVDPNKQCGECSYCRCGMGHFCEKMTGIGTTVNGGFAEYCAVPEEQAVPFSHRLSYEEAAMTEPVSCCIHGIDMCEIHPGDTVAVYGAGMIGLLMLQLAKQSGAAKIIVIEPVGEKRLQAEELGAALTIDPIHEDVIETLAKYGFGRISTVIECAGRTETMEQAIEIAGKKSVVMMFGLTKPDAEISVKPFTLFKKEMVLKSSFINPYTYQRAVSLIEEGAIDVKSMICDKIPLEELPGILADRKKRSIGKYIIVFE